MYIGYPTIIDLPIDVLIEILSKLPNAEIAQFCQTNPYLNSICQNNRLWTQKFLNDFLKLNINEYGRDLYSYIDVYKSLIKPLSRIKRVTIQPNENITLSTVYAESLGTVYLSFLVEEERIANFINYIQRYVTENSVIAIINSEQDPLIAGLNISNNYHWFENSSKNTVITEVIILDLDDLTKQLKQYSNTADFKMTQGQLNRIIRMIKSNIPLPNKRLSLEEAKVRLSRMITK